MIDMSADELAFKQSLEVLSLTNVLPGMAAIFDLLDTRRLSVHISPAVLLDPDDVDDAF